MLYNEMLKQGHTFTTPYYAGQVQKLAEAARQKRPRQTFMHPVHENARPHIGYETRTKLEELG